MFIYLQNFEQENRIRDSHRGIQLSIEGYWVKQFDGGMATVRDYKDEKISIVG